MTSELDSAAPSRGDRARARAYARDFWPGMVGYVVVLVAVTASGGLHGAGPGRFGWALLPVVPAVWVMRDVVRHLRRLDDYQASLLLRGVAGGFAAAMLAAVTVGFLGIAGLPVRLGGWVVYVAGMLGWIVSGAVVRRRR